MQQKLLKSFRPQKFERYYSAHTDTVGYYIHTSTELVYMSHTGYKHCFSNRTFHSLVRLLVAAKRSDHNHFIVGLDKI